MDRRAARWLAAMVAGAVSLALVACTASGPQPAAEPAAESAAEPAAQSPAAEPGSLPPAPGEITLAFAGDVHFEAHLARLLRRPGGGLGPMTATLREADLAMLNLESAITERGRRAPKEREEPDDRYHFRTSGRALDVLADAGVDVVSMANNHVGDYGPVGLMDTLVAARDAPVAVVGIGRDADEAFAPYRARVGDLDVAFLAADTVFREGRSDVWAAGPDNAGAAAARQSRPTALLAAVREAADTDDLVVVYLHWGREYQSCATHQQRTLGRLLAWPTSSGTTTASPTRGC